jgi:hypothetical protein
VRACVAIALAFVILTNVSARADGNPAPTLLSAGAQQRHPTSTWTLPTGLDAQAIEVATSPDATVDGAFLTENTVAYDLLGATDTSWRWARTLAPGTYYVHVQASDDVWSNVLTFTIANTPPRLSGSIRLVGRGAVFVQAAIRLCDDEDGEPTLLIDQRKRAGSMTFARASSKRHLFFFGNCRRFTVRWRLASTFYGVGSYTVRLQVRDDDGALSNVVARTWATRH